VVGEIVGDAVGDMVGLVVGEVVGEVVGDVVGDVLGSAMPCLARTCHICTALLARELQCAPSGSSASVRSIASKFL